MEFCDGCIAADNLRDAEIEACERAGVVTTSAIRCYREQRDAGVEPELALEIASQFADAEAELM